MPQSICGLYCVCGGKERNILDLNRNAFRVVKSLTEEKTANPRSKNARAAGRRGGPARAQVLSPERRREIAEHANQARWGQRDRQT
jgi:hypothetical protein